MAPDRVLYPTAEDIEAIALRERERRERHILRLVMWVCAALILFMTLLVVVQTILLVNLGKHEDARARQSREQLQLSVCQIERSQRNLIEHFGGTPPLPSPECR